MDRFPVPAGLEIPQSRSLQSTGLANNRFHAGIIPAVIRAGALLTTLIFALIFGFGIAQPEAKAHGPQELQELEFGILHPDGSMSGVHFLVRSANEREAFSAALEAVSTLHPGATVFEAPGPDADAQETTGTPSIGQWLPWGWQWDEAELPVKVAYNPSGALRGFGENDMRYALELWTAVPASGFAFEYAGTTRLPASLNVDGTDGANVVAWQDLGCDDGCVLGLTTKSFDQHEVDISLNSNPRARLGNGANGTYDALTVLIHELGHMVGLEHSCPPYGPCSEEESEAAMFYSYSGIRHELAENDRAGIAELYPAPEGVSPSATQTPSRGSTPSPPSVGGVAVELFSGWNLTGLPAASPADIAARLTCVEAIYAFDETEGWSHWIRDMNPIFQTLESTQRDGAYWVLASEDCSATLPG